jgi:hypothetical protein
MYFISGLLPELRHNHQPFVPNEEFHRRHAALKIPVKTVERQI